MTFKILVAVLILVGAVVIGTQDLSKRQDKLHFDNVQLKSRSVEIKKLEADYDILNTKYDQAKGNEQKIKELEQERQQLKERENDLNKQLQARAEEKARVAKAAESVANTITATKTASANSIAPTGASVGNCGDNMYKQYIYQHESGCDTNRYNSIGCYGIGQACPASKVKDNCGADFACQDAWFSNYAVQRYGSWEQAYYYWLQHHWW